MSTRCPRFDLGYDGTDFWGRAAQPRLHTVQGEVEAVLAMASCEDVVTTVAGRTNAGVHACYRVYHADISEAAWARLLPRGGELDEQAIALAIVRRLSKVLPGHYGECARGRDLAVVRGICDMRIHSAAVVDPSFDARFSALGHSYVYRVSDRPEFLGRWDRLQVEEPPDGAAMDEAGAALFGEHDFLGFCHPCEGAMTIRAPRTLLAECDAEGTLVFRVEVDAFRHSMVRSLVGVLLLVGSGARDVAYPVQILRARSRSEAAPIAPAHRLTFEGVEYPDSS